MGIFNNWVLYVILYLIFAVTFNQSYKLVTIRTKNVGALTVLIQLLAGTISLLMIPFFEIKISTIPVSYIFLFFACIFYALNDRLSTTVRKEIEVSTFSILKQLKTVFMIFCGLLFFKEPFILNKFVGAFLIIISNFLVLYKKGSFKFNKYIILGLIANFFITIALFIDVNYSEQFNLPIYTAITLIVPALLIYLFEKIKVKDIIEEYKIMNKKLIFLTALSWSIMMIVQLRAYQLGKVMIVATLCSLTVIFNIITSYIVLKEKNNLLRKILARILIIIGIILIKV